MMKKSLLIIVSICMTLVSTGQSHLASFCSVTSSGHNLWYNIFSDIHGNYAVVTGPVSPSVQGTLVIPESVEYAEIMYPVRGIESYAFNANSQLTSVVLPQNMHFIGNNAFMDCIRLESINLNDAIDSIGGSAFSGCYSLISIHIPLALTNIEASLFSGCSSLQNIIIPESIVSIGNNAFYGCSSLTSIRIPRNIEEIGGWAFVNCCNLDTIYFDAIDCIQMGRRSGSIYYDVFNDEYNPYNEHCLAPVSVLYLGDSVRNIPYHAFNGCYVSSLTIPASVENIEEYAFSGGGINSIKMRGFPPQITNNSFNGINNYCSIYVPCGTMSSYQNASGWNVFTHFLDACVTINTSVNDFTKGGVAGGGNYMIGDSVTLTAIPFVGSHFIGWSNGSQQNPLSFVATQSQTIVAAFGNGPLPHDTIYVHDTTYINNYIHDTTIHYVDRYIHDTTFYAVYIHDTAIIHDTIYINIEIPIHDTTIVSVLDTLIVYDTVPFYDTIWLNDTVIVHDTIYIHQNVIDGIDAMKAKVFSCQGQIVVEGADGNRVTLYDVNGCVLATKQDDYTPLYFDTPASGTYMIKIGAYPARKVVVIR